MMGQASAIYFLLLDF